MTKTVRIKNTMIGGGSPVLIQSMLNVPLEDTENAISQAVSLQNAGCEILRASIPSRESAAKIPEIMSEITIPLVADIHFDYRLAILAAEAGVSALRINPGNIGGKENVRAVAECAKEHNIPIRIGVNGGSLEADLLEKYHHPTAEAMVESAERHIAMLAENDFDNIVISLKSSDTQLTISANRLFAEKYDYPLHLGVTEAGAGIDAMMRSAVGIGTLLSLGIGDTIRVSLTGDPLPEIDAAKMILSACNLRREGVRIVSCPTCARCHTDTLSVINEVREATKAVRVPITAAVMGCSVNGPGEAREADVGIACGYRHGKLFKNGEVVEVIPKADYASRLIAEIFDIERARQC